MKYIYTKYTIYTIINITCSLYEYFHDLKFFIITININTIYVLIYQKKKQFNNTIINQYIKQQSLEHRDFYILVESLCIKNFSNIPYNY